MTESADCKSCSQCKVEQPKANFYKMRLGRDGLAAACKDCSARKEREKYARNPEAKQAMNKAWAQADPTRGQKRSAAWRKANPDAAREVTRRYESKKPEAGYARVAHRRALQIKATPTWANRFFIKEIYHLAKMRSASTGFVWHVDHIIPLRSPLVCGLHVEANLRVIPATENMSKGNRF